MRRECDQAACERLGIDDSYSEVAAHDSSLVLQAHTVSCLTSVSMAKHLRYITAKFTDDMYPEEYAWMQLSKNSRRHAPDHVSQLPPIHPQDCALSSTHAPVASVYANDDVALADLIDGSPCVQERPGSPPETSAGRPGVVQSHGRRDLEELACVIPGDGDTSYMTDVIGATTQEAKIPVAMDSGSCDNVIHPDDLPEDIVIVPDPPGTKHFKGANDSHIERYGTIATTLKQDGKAAIRGNWVGADASRALHSVSTVCGPPQTPNQDVLFDSEKCYVVPRASSRRSWRRSRPSLSTIGWVVSILPR